MGRATRQPTNTLREREHGVPAGREHREMQVDLGAGEEAVGTHRKVWIGRGRFGCERKSVQKDRRTQARRWPERVIVRRLRDVFVARRAWTAGPTAGQAPSSQGEGGRDSRVRGAGAIFQRKRIVAGARRNVTRIREPVGCEPMECCRGRREASTAGTRRWARSGALGRGREGEGRGTSFAKAGGGRRNGPRSGCARERRKTGAGAITVKASTT